MEPETELFGGNLTRVVRVGDTVRRRADAWTPAVHTLLRHLEAVGFEGAPQALGTDAQGRESLSFLPGEAAHYPLAPFVLTDEALVAVVRLLRRYHDATVGFVPPPDARWQFPVPGPHEVICHNDVAPYNTIFVDGRPQAFIDFDFAAPGPRIWDLAHAAYRFVPLCGLSHEAGRVDGSVLRMRVRRFVEAYGGGIEGDLWAVLPERLRWLGDWMVSRAEMGDPAGLRLVEEGHLAFYRREAEFWERKRRKGLAPQWD